jgi:phosphoribosylformimino-5-aminoimidazole carboxamide ribotide isomerase
MTLRIIPAIDLLDGSCVRLLHGDFNRCKVYELDAGRLAADYADQGAEWLHVVDLAASRDGPKADTRPLMRLLQSAPQSVQTGGGVRNESDIQNRLGSGAQRVVVGSMCVTHENGVPWPRTHGWTRGSDRTLWDWLDFYGDKGLRHVLCTDIGRDGALTGPNLELYARMASRYPSLEIQASGGVSGLVDLRQLATTGVPSAIVGKALLEGCFTVREAQEFLA